MAFTRTLATDDLGYPRSGFTQCGDCGLTHYSADGVLASMELAMWENTHLPSGVGICTNGVIRAELVKKSQLQRDLLKAATESLDGIPDLSDLEKLEKYIEIQIESNAKEYAGKLNTATMKKLGFDIAYGFHHRAKAALENRGGSGKSRRWSKKRRQAADANFLAGFTAAYADILEKIHADTPK